MKIELIDESNREKCDHSKVPQMWGNKDPVLFGEFMSSDGELHVQVLGPKECHISGKMGTKTRLGRGIRIAIERGKALGLKGEFCGSGLSSLLVVFVDDKEVMVYHRRVIIR